MVPSDFRSVFSVIKMLQVSASCPVDTGTKESLTEVQEHLRYEGPDTNNHKVTVPASVLKHDDEAGRTSM